MLIVLYEYINNYIIMLTVLLEYIDLWLLGIVATLHLSIEQQCGNFGASKVKQPWLPEFLCKYVGSPFIFIHLNYINNGINNIDLSTQKLLFWHNKKYFYTNQFIANLLSLQILKDAISLLHPVLIDTF